MVLLMYTTVPDMLFPRRKVV